MAKKIVSSETIKADLEGLGVQKGDVVFIAADLMRVGYHAGSREKTIDFWLHTLLDAVGKEGTLIIPSYTKSFPRWRKDPECVFSMDSKTTSGVLSEAFSSHSNVIRSKHPTNSCFGIGPDAEFILQDHDEKASSYGPYQRVISLGGKNLMLGAVSDEKLAPMAIHAAQEYLEITKRNWQSGLIQSFYINDQNKKKLFTRYDIGGCTSFGYKTIGHHLVSRAINIGKVGRGWAAYIDCKKSFQLICEIYKQQPSLLKCDNKHCRDCFGSPPMRKPLFWIKDIFSKLRA